MSKNKKAPARSKAKIEYLLTTKLFCGHCREMMTGFSSKGHLGTTYRYYICNGKKDKKCKKKMISKEYIEELILAECRKVLSPFNIDKIAKEVVAVCEAEQNTSYLQHLKRCLSENERKQKNARNAVVEADDPEVRADLYKDILQLKKEHEELKKQIAQESAVLPTLTEPKIKFFLTALKKGNVNDIKYRKTLINILVNKIFLYDDRVTITFNSGEAPVTIDDILLSKISESTSCPEGLILKDSGPPFTRNCRACRPGNFLFIILRKPHIGKRCLPCAALVCPRQGRWDGAAAGGMEKEGQLIGYPSFYSSASSGRNSTTLSA